MDYHKKLVTMQFNGRIVSGVSYASKYDPKFVVIRIIHNTCTFDFDSFQQGYASAHRDLPPAKHWTKGYFYVDMKHDQDYTISVEDIKGAFA